MRPLVCLALSILSFPLFAWGPEGHQLVARIAETQLNPATRSRIAEILGADRDMVSVATWADEVRPARRETAPWHFVDIPIQRSRFDPERDCPKGACVVSTIARLRGVLADPAVPADERREALQFLIHFIGDMHQPLHATDNGDRGGNTIQVEFHGRQTNLHSLWDSGILGAMAPAEQIFPALSEQSARGRRKWAGRTVTDWTEESHKIGRKVVYGKLPKTAQGAPVVIDRAYEQAAVGVIREQLARAGARLAAVLNADLR